MKTVVTRSSGLSIIWDQTRVLIPFMVVIGKYLSTTLITMWPFVYGQSLVSAWWNMKLLSRNILSKQCQLGYWLRQCSKSCKYTGSSLEMRRYILKFYLMVIRTGRGLTCIRTYCFCDLIEDHDFQCRQVLQAYTLLSCLVYFYRYVFYYAHFIFYDVSWIFGGYDTSAGFIGAGFTYLFGQPTSWRLNSPECISNRIKDWLNCNF